MYRGRRLQNISFPNGFSRKDNAYKIEIVSSNIVNNLVDQKYEVKFKINSNTNLNAADYLEDFPESKTFEYYDTILYEPKEQREEVSTLPGYPTYRFRDQFNYRPSAYVEYASKIEELDIPNFYLSIMDEGNDKYESSFVFKNNLTSRETFLDTANFVAKKQIRSIEASQRTKNILLTKDAEQYKEGIDINGDSKTDINSLRNLFPFAIDMKYQFTDNDLFSNLLDKYNLHQSFMNYLLHENKQTFQLQKTDRDFDIVNQKQMIDLEFLDFDKFLTKLFFKKYYNYIILPDQKNESIYMHNIRKFKANIELQNSGDKPISFETIKNKLSTNSELLYLKVEKFIGNSDVGEPYQTFYMSGNSSIYEYYDTQVKNRQYYTYKISGIYLLSGAEYGFTHEQSDSVTCTITRKRRIIEHHILTRSVYVMQPLQLPPKVEVYKHSNKNKVFFHLMLNREQPRYIPFEGFTESDKQFTQILNNTKQYENPEHNYTLEPAKFEVFKTTVEPYSLDDLSDSSLLATRIIRNRTDHLFADFIEYEKDYYYLFRAINLEGFPGNPTKLYKVRMQKGIEQNILHVEMKDFIDKPEEYDISKNFNKLMHIFPNENQNIMTNLKDIEGNSFKGKINIVEVGLKSVPSVWGKKFKFRITSNNTGKKMDFNVKFSIKRNILDNN